MESAEGGGRECSCFTGLLIRLFQNALFWTNVTAIPALNREFGNNLMCHPVQTKGTEAETDRVAKEERKYSPKGAKIQYNSSDSAAMPNTEKSWMPINMPPRAGGKGRRGRQTVARIEIRFRYMVGS